MSGTLKKVRFIRSWKDYRVGAQITPNGVLRDWLVAKGYVEVIDAPSPVRAQGHNRQATPSSRRQQR